MAHSDLRREILFEISDVARALRTHIDQRAREHGMTRAQWAVLNRLQRKEGASQVELAEALELQPISLMRLIDRLCDQDLVERRADPNDRRVNLLYLTAKGRALLQKLAPLGRDIAREVLDDLGDAQALDLLHKLLLIKKNIRNATGKRNAPAGAEGGRGADAN